MQVSSIFAIRHFQRHSGWEAPNLSTCRGLNILQLNNAFHTSGWSLSSVDQAVTSLANPTLMVWDLDCHWWIFWWSMPLITHHVGHTVMLGTCTQDLQNANITFLQTLIQFQYPFQGKYNVRSMKPPLQNVELKYMSIGIHFSSVKLELDSRGALSCFFFKTARE